MVKADPVPWSPPVPLDAYSLPAFPVTALPEWLSTFVSALAEETQTPVDLAGMLSLAVLATAIAKRAVVSVRTNWDEPLSLWLVVILGSGNRKTAVLNRLTQPVASYEQEILNRSRPALAVQASERRTLEAQLHRAELKIANSEAPAEAEAIEGRRRLAERLASLPPSSAFRMLVEDVTPEQLASLLAEQGGRIAVLSDEGGIFGMMAGRYAKNGISNLDIYLKGDSGSDLRVDRRGRPPELVAAPALTFGLAVQPDVIRSLPTQPGFRGRGLLARFLYCGPREFIGARKVQSTPVSPLVQRVYAERVAGLLAGAEGVREQDFTPLRLELSNHGGRVLDEFREKLEPQLGEQGSLGFIVDWASKLPGKVARIAGLLHVAQSGSLAEAARSPIEALTVAAATTVGWYLVEHAKAAFGEMNADPARRSARLIVSWVSSRQARRFTKRDLFNSLRGKFERAVMLDEPLQILEEFGCIRALPRDREARAGRPASPEYEVNPHLIPHKLHNTHNSQCAYSANLANRSLPEASR